MRPNFFHHLHPPTIPAAQARWRYTLGAGGMAVFLVLVLIVTGMLEMFYYIPTPAEAALSIQTISYLVPFGGLVRNLHYWAGQLLLVVSGVHLLRVVFTGAYARRGVSTTCWGWHCSSSSSCSISPATSCAGTRASSGRWWWAPTWSNPFPGLASSLYQMLVGGAQPGAATLIRFYTWHVFGLMLLAAHPDHLARLPRPPGWRHRRSTTQTAHLIRAHLPLRAGAPRSPRHAAHRQPACCCFQPSSPPRSPRRSPRSLLPAGDTHAPWFFLWVQQLLKWGDPFLLGVLVPLLVLVLLALIPYIFPQPG